MAAEEPTIQPRPLMFPDFGPGTCINCGFLAFSFDGDLQQAQELSLRRRAYPHGQDPINHPEPLPGFWHCFVFAGNLPGEMADLEQRGVPGHERQGQIIAKGRACPEFYTWVPGRDPRWHHQDRETMRLEEMRRANDLKIAELDRRSQESMLKIAELTAQATADHLELAKTVSEEGTWYQRAFLVLAIIAIILALATLAYPDGVTWLVDYAPGGANDPVSFEATPTP
jgi:hypothetical protein